jgi:hypothetical protein
VKAVLAGMLAGLLSVSAIANSNSEIRAEIFKGINKICDSYKKGPVRVYCQDSQIYGYERFGSIIFSAKSNEKLANVVNECAKRFRIDEKVIDYGMTFRCISLNIKNHNIKLKPNKQRRAQ